MVKVLRNVLIVVVGWVVFFAFLQGMFGSIAGLADNESATLPDTKGMGLEYARKVALKDKGFVDVSAFDATGRHRSTRTAKSWVVCDQYTSGDKGVLQPVSGRAKHNTPLKLGVVLLDEPCPRTLSGNQPINTGDEYRMPNFRGTSITDVVQRIGPEASLRFYSALNGAEIKSRQYGQWQVCSQQLSEGALFYGQPVAFTAVKFDNDSRQPTNLEQVCPDNGWQGVKNQDPRKFPAIVERT